MGNLIYPRFLVTEIYAIELVVCEGLGKTLCDPYVMYIKEYIICYMLIWILLLNLQNIYVVYSFTINILNLFTFIATRSSFQSLKFIF